MRSRPWVSRAGCGVGERTHHSIAGVANLLASEGRHLGESQYLSVSSDGKLEVNVVPK